MLFSDACAGGPRRITSLCLCIILVAVTVSLVAGRICYKCDSRLENCPEDSVKGVNTITCSEGNNFCQVVMDGRYGEHRFIRDCIVSCDKEYVNWKKGDEEYCKTCCDADECNVGRCGGESVLFCQKTLFVIISVVFALCGAAVVV